MAQELSPRAVMASLMWAVGLYLGLWLVPEPATKGVAAVLTVLLTAWLGVDTVWGLMNGWATLARQANEASRFEELRAAGAEFARILGTDAARAIILTITVVTGGALSRLSAQIRSLPGFALARIQLEGQGLSAEVLSRMAQVKEVAASGEGAFAMVVAADEAVPEALVGFNEELGTVSAPGRPAFKEVYRHRGGNRQVELSNGQRWHLPRGTAPNEIPASDPLGDELQAAAREVAAKWGPDKLTSKEKEAIARMLQQGKPYRAAHLERQARGRWVEEELRQLFRHLEWNHRGVDVTNPLGERFHYEVLSGTESNFELHGRRMSSIFFRMIFF